jgi:MFS family permease
MNTHLEPDWRQLFTAALVPASVELVWALYNAFVPLMLQGGNPEFSANSSSAFSGFGLGAFSTGLVLAAGNIIVLVITLFTGALSDTTHSRWGRRKPWFAFPAPALILGLILMPVIMTMIPEEAAGQPDKLVALLALFAVAMALIIIPLSFIRSPAMVLLYDLTPSEARGTASALNGVSGGVAAVAGGLIGALLFDVFPPLPFWLAAAFVGAAISAAFFFLKEPGNYEKDGFIIELTHVVLKKIARQSSSQQTRSIGFLFITMLLTFGGFGIFQTFLTSYTVSVLEMSAAQSALLFSLGAASFMTAAFPASYVSSHFLSRKHTQIIGLLIYALSSLMIYLWADPKNVWFLVMINSAGLAFALITQEVMMIDSAPSDRFLGTFASFVQTARYIAYVITPAMGGWLIQSLGHNYNLIWMVTALLQTIALLTAMAVSTGEAHRKDGAFSVI